jgi:hypothetical protein
VGIEDINPINFLVQEAINSSQESLPTCNDRAVSPLLPAPGLEIIIDDPPPDPLELQVPRTVWDELGLDLAPFTVQAQAPMSLVHFYFSQLTLNCVFVVDKGRFVGMINKADMMKGDF